jgi:hypothetical protein
MSQINQLKSGRHYRVQHKVKGNFTIKLIRTDSRIMITGTVVKGNKDVKKDSTLNINLELATLKEVKKPVRKAPIKKGARNGRRN